MIKKTNWRAPLLVGLAVGLVCSALMWLGIFGSWSNRLSDRLYASHPADQRIVIVAIDDAAMARLGRWPWPRAVHAELIDAISRQQPLVVGYDVNFPETSDQENDEALAQSLRSAGNVILPVELEITNLPDVVTYNNQKVLTPIPMIAVAAARLGHTNTPQDVDGVVRRVPLEAVSGDGSRVPAFAAQAASLGGVIIDPSEGTDEAGRLIVNYPDKPRQGFPTVSAADVIDGRVEPDLFKDKFVLVGSTASNLHDDQLIPTSASQPMPGVEIHASILDTLLQKRFLFELPLWLKAFWIILICLFLGLAIPFLRARTFVPLVVSLWIASLVGSILLFDRGWIVDILWPTIALLLAFGAIVLERRIESEKQKREIRSAFSRYVSHSVVESILDNPDKLKLGGDRRVMTVLFSDVRGFTSISEGLKPEQLVEIMNRYLTRMTDIVFEHDGVLDKYIGDAVMAFWNAPFDQSDHARRAVDTALDMLAALRQMNDEKQFGDLEFKIGVGINTGDMVVGNMGSEKRFDYTVIGDSVNLASRLESLTKEYVVSLLITQATSLELGSGYLLRTLDLVAVKGKKEPVKIFEVMKKIKNASPVDKEFVAKFDQALAAYFAKDFARAVALTDELLALRPDDGPSKTLKTRAQHFITEPPSADWNGVWVMTKK